MANGVTVVMPTLNEAQFIGSVLMALINQEWSEALEILVVDGMSSDSTPQIVEQLAAKTPAKRSITLLFNKQRNIPSALNIGIRAATHDIIIRLDGHTRPPSNFVQAVVRCLNSKGPRAIVGGRCKIVPSNTHSLAQAIAVAVSSRFGIGNAVYRTFNRDASMPLAVDTVPFGAYRRLVWTELGGYDESLFTAEDYDFNYRARQLGIGVWLLPNVSLSYYARGDLRDLWQQYFRYGYWSAQLCRKHNRVPALRKLVPGLFVSWLAFFAVAFPPLFCASLAVYGLVTIGTSLVVGNAHRSIKVSLWLMVAFPVIHFSYGVGSLFSLGTKRAGNA